MHLTSLLRVGLGIGLFLLAGLAAAGPPRWTQDQAPFRIWGTTYDVGSAGLSAILITSPQGDILIDATLPANAAMIERHIRQLGVRLHDIKLILNTHAHIDHAGGLARLARDSGATVMASPESAYAMMHGGMDAADPQYGESPAYPPVVDVRLLHDGQVVRLGPLALTAHFTPGHTPGSTSWTWRSCQQHQCLTIAYVDSLTAMGNASYHFGDPRHPERLTRFRQTLATVADLPCDILVTPHPEASDFLERVAAHRRGATPDPLRDRSACRRYAADAAATLKARLTDESRAPAH